MNKPERSREYDELLRWATRTFDPHRVTLPIPSRFPSCLEDFKHIQDKGIADIVLHHRACGGEVRYVPHPTDPILSTYACEGQSLRYGNDVEWCNQLWDWRYLLERDRVYLGQEFVTELIEPDLTWPERLCLVTEGKRCFHAVRKLTGDEVFESRVRRLLEIRERAS